jgi:4-amino-4-deoxy-L-arabinose transferase-like glycosyltransferase
LLLVDDHRVSRIASLRRAISPSLLLICAAIFLLAFVTRAGALKQYVTPDEPNWVWRSLAFSRALSEGDWLSTAQIGHPGVTTMWLGSLGIVLKRLTDPVATTTAIQWLGRITTLSPDNAEAFKQLGVFLTYARLPVIFVNALGVVLIFLLARRLFGMTVGLLAGLLFALDPFTAGLSGLLHVDGLLTTFSILCVLALLNGLLPSTIQNRRSEIGWFALAGAFAGLAFLSKSPGIFLTGFAILLLFVAVITRRVSFKRSLLCFLSFVVIHWSFVIVLYPAMWVQPIETVGGILGLAKFLSENAVRPTFFDGQYALNHGAGFYPLALAYRVTPIVVIGLIAAAVGAAARRKQPAADRLTGLGLLAFAVLFIVFITPAAKKFDRYMLPAEAMLILIAAWGIGTLARRWRFAPALAVIGALAIVLINWPHLLMQYNLLWGGAAEAQQHFAVGWGEGLGAAANWINRQPDGLQSTAATTAIPSFAPIFSGQSRNTFERDLELSDYYVVTLSERQLIPEFYADLERRGDVVQTLRTGMVEGAWVLRNKQAQQQAETLQQANPQTDALVTLVDLPVSRAYVGAARQVVLPRALTAEQLEQILNDLSTRYRRLWITWSPTVLPILQQQIRQWLNQTATLAQSQDFDETQVAAYDLKPGVIGRIDPFRVQFNGNFALADVLFNPAGRSGSIETRWQALAPLAAPYSVTLQLIDQTGTTWAQLGGLIQDQNQIPAQQWPLGQAVDQVFHYALPDEAPAGPYDLRLGIEQADGQRAGLFSASGHFSGTAPVLASFQVPPRAEQAYALTRATEFTMTHRWADKVEIVGFDSGPGVVTNGDVWLVDVVWGGLRPDLPDLQVIWEISDQDNQQIYRAVMPLSHYPTSRWREGEIIGSRYALRFPADLKPADYHVSIGVAGPDGQLLNGGMFTPFDVRLLRRDRSFETPQPQHSLDVTFDDPAIRLMGADFPTQTLQAGVALPLTLYWQAAGTTENLYTVFTHLETLDGRVIAQIDSQPQGGGMPTPSWAAGQSIVDPYPLVIPPDTPPGAYRIVVGLYNPLDGTHLIDTRTGEDAVVLEPAVIVK